jgi:hypothetical protein
MSAQNPSVKSYNYKHTFPNGKTYNVGKKYISTGKPRGRPKLTVDQRIENLKKRSKELEEKAASLTTNN